MAEGVPPQRLAFTHHGPGVQLSESGTYLSLSLVGCTSPDPVPFWSRFLYAHRFSTFCVKLWSFPIQIVHFFFFDKPREAVKGAGAQPHSEGSPKAAGVADTARVPSHSHPRDEGQRRLAERGVRRRA